MRRRQPASMSLMYGGGFRKFLYILPYERKREKWRYACLQVGKVEDGPEEEAPSGCALAQNRFFLLLADSGNVVRSVSSKIPNAFGYTPQNLVGMNLSDLFSS